MLTKDDIKSIDNLLSRRFMAELAPIKSDISKMRNGIDVIISLFDRKYIDLRKRIERIEGHFDLPPVTS